MLPDELHHGNLVNFVRRKSQQHGAEETPSATCTSRPAPAGPAASGSTTRVTSSACVTRAWTPSACSCWTRSN
jgi:hypothetical protein